MPNYPDEIKTFREKENKSGVIFDPTKKTVLYAEDLKEAETEIVDIETVLGLNPQGLRPSVSERLKFFDIPFRKHFNTMFESLHPWEFNGPGSHLLDGGSLVLKTDPGSASYVEMNNVEHPYFLEFQKNNPCFSVLVCSSDDNETTFSVSMGGSYNLFGEQGFGFRQSQGKLYAWARGSSGEDMLFDLGEIPFYYFRLLSAVLDQNTKNIYYYIDGVLVYTLLFSWRYTPEQFSSKFFCASVFADASTSKYLRLLNLEVSIDT